MSNFWEGDTVVAPKGGNFWDSDPVAAAPDPVTVNKVARSAATGVPVVGGLLNKLDAATNATLAPVVEPFLTPSDQDISRKGETWSQRYAKSKAMQDAADAKMAAEHPIVDTAAKIAGGVVGTIPAMTAAPAAFGLSGTLPQMVARGAASNAALGGVDAAIRGEDPTTAAAIGGAVGAAAPLVARGVGALARGIKDYRNPAPVVPQNVERVAGVDVPLTTGQATLDPRIQSEEEVMRKGGRGTSAEDIARQADQQAQQAVGEASGNISKMMDPTGSSASTAPQAAGGAVQTELAAQEQARQAAAQAEALRVQNEGTTLAQGLGGGAAPASPLDAAEGVGSAVSAKAAQAKATAQAAYKARDAVPGAFDESVPKGLAEDIRGRLNQGENPLWVDPTNESTANQALKLIDQTLGKDSGLFHNRAAPPIPKDVKPVPVAAPAAEDETTAALRAKFGDSVADAYAKQNIKAPEFIRSAAIRHKGKIYEGQLHSDAYESAAKDTGNEFGQVIAKTNPRDAGFVTNTGRYVDREEAAKIANGAGQTTHNVDSLSGENLSLKAPASEHEPMAQSIPVDLKTIDEARKRLSTMFGDAKAAAIRSGDRSDMRAMGKILHEFDNSISDALESGKFSGDAKLAKKLMDEARASHAEYRQTFSSRGPGDQIGRDIEKILGKYTDTAATPDQIAALSYGPASEPGGGKAQQIAIRLKKILGDQSPEWGKYKQGLFAHVRGDESLSPAEKAARIDKFLTGRGRGLANVALEPAEKRALASYSTSLKGVEPAAKPTDRVGKALQRITGADGHPPATIDEVVKMLFGRGARGDGLSTELSAYLKKNLSGASLVQLKQGALEHLVLRPEGQADYTSNAIAKRLSEYLDGDLSKVLNTPEELAEMRKLMLVHNKLTPLPGTTNPSGSAFFGQKMMKSAGKNLMTMLGFAHGGIGGAVVGHGLDAVGGMVKDARAGKKATQLFFGKQAKSPIVQSRIPQLLAPTVAQRAQGGAQ